MIDNGACSYHRFIEGDWSGMKEIIEEYYDGLVFFLKRYMGNELDAEDMAEETLLVLVNKKPPFRGDSLFKTWLYNIGRNTAIKYLHKNRSSIPVSPEDLAALRLADPSSTPDDADVLSKVVKNEELSLINRALDRLPEKYRSVLLLKYIEKMTAKEIGSVLHHTEHSINSLLKRAKIALRAELSKEGIGP